MKKDKSKIVRMDKKGETLIASSEEDLNILDTDSLVEPSSDFESKRKERDEAGPTVIIKLNNSRSPSPGIKKSSSVEKEYEGVLEGIELADGLQIFQIWMSLEHALEIIGKKLYMVVMFKIKYTNGTMVMDCATKGQHIIRFKIERIEKGTVSCQMWLREE